MAALVTLTDDQRALLPKLVNNLNFAVRNLNIGQLFVDVLDGTNTRVLETRDLWEIQFILNKLNLGTFHYEFGDLFVDLLQGTAIDITANHKDDLARVLNKLNMSLTALQFGELAAEAISPAAPAAVTPPGPGTVDVSYAQGDIKVTFAGTTGAGTASKTSTDKAGTTVAIAPTSGLSNGGSVTATVTAKAGYTVNSKQSVTFSYPVSGLAAAPAPKTVNGKTLDAQVGGTVIAADDLFAYGGGADKSNVTNVTGTKANWDDSAKTLTLDNDATGDITLTFDVAGGATKGSTAAKLTNVTAKP